MMKMMTCVSIADNERVKWTGLIRQKIDENTGCIKENSEESMSLDSDKKRDKKAKNKERK